MRPPLFHRGLLAYALAQGLGRDMHTYEMRNAEDRRPSEQMRGGQSVVISLPDPSFRRGFTLVIGVLSIYSVLR